MPSNEELFKNAFQKRQKAEEEKKDKKTGNFTRTYEDVKYCAPVAGSQRAFRFVGKPPEFREKSTDAKTVKFSRWLNDKAKSYIDIIWKVLPDGNLDDSWLLTEFYNDVMSRTWVNYTDEDKKANPKIADKKGYFKFHNEDSPTFQRIFNNTRKGDLYPPKYYPQDLVIQNCIDRNNDWCTTYNHTKLFAKRLDIWEDKKSGNMVEDAKEPGYSLSLLSMIYRKLSKSPIFVWEKVDLVMEKTDDQAKYDVSTACSVEISDEMKKIASKEPLTEAEEKYEMYDIDKLFPVASYNKIKRNFLNLFKSWDVETGKNYTERLEKLAEEEKNKWIAENSNKNELKEEESENTSTATNNSKDYYNEVISKEEEKPVERIPAREEFVERKSETNTITKADLFPFYDKLSPADKDCVDKNFDKVDMENKKVIWKTKTAVCDPTCMYPKLGTRSMSPMEIKQCPICGKKY